MTPAGVSPADHERGPSEQTLDDQTPALTVAAVARRLGVAPATLRTWDRRYGLGPSEHVAGAHRRYTSADTERLLVMRRLTLEGVAPAEAARIARDSTPEQRPGPPAPRTLSLALQRGDRSTAGAGLSGLPAAARGAGAERPGRWSPASDAVTVGLVTQLVRAHDVSGATQALTTAALGQPVESWWTSLVEPVSRALGEPAALAGPGEDPQTVLAAAVLGALRQRRDPDRTRSAAAEDVPSSAVAPAGPAGPVIVVRPAVGATWSLAAHVLAVAAQSEGVPAGVLPAGAAEATVLEVIDHAHPRAVVLLGLADGADIRLVNALHDQHPGLSVFVNPGPDGAEGLPWGASVHRVRTFTGTLHEVLAVTG